MTKPKLDPYTEEAVAQADRIVPAVRAKGHVQTKTDKLIAMAAQDVSPEEASVARSKLALIPGGSTDPHEMVVFAFRALEQANGIQAIKQVRDGASAIQEYMKDRGLGVDVENEAALVILAAERKAGFELTRMKADGEVRSEGQRSDRVAVEGIESYGITRDQSSWWQRLAKLDDTQFAELVHAKREAGERLARVDFLREVQRLFPVRRPDVVPPPAPPAEPRSRTGPEPEPAPLPEEPTLPVADKAWARWDKAVNALEELQYLLDHGWVPEGRLSQVIHAEVNAAGKTILTMQRLAGPA